MKVLIIEDEINAAIDLKQMLETIRPGFIIQGVTDSIEKTTEWLTANPPPDLIFSDIQLGDGLCFEIFRKIPVTCPVIFLTAYDEYAIKAFETNGIAYLLKPLDEQKLTAGLQKLENLSAHLSGSQPPLQNLLTVLHDKYKHYKSSFLVAFKGKRFPVDVSDIAYFTVKNTLTWLCTLSGNSYQIPQRLDELEEMLNPRLFYRANRQYLIAFTAIKEMEEDFGRKLLLNLSVKTEEPIIISKPKSPDFLRWMEER